MTAVTSKLHSPRSHSQPFAPGGRKSPQQPSSMAEHSDDAGLGHPWCRGPITDDRALIVAGTYRAGTTSLFTYLAGHPEIRPAKIKEPGFFFSLKWTEQPPPFPAGDEVAAYLSMFPRQPAGGVLLEATPNYLHDAGAAGRIAEAMPRAKIVLILREPVERLVSWYQHSLFQSRLVDVSFDDWIVPQLEHGGPEPQDYMQLALAHGRYSDDVAEFIRVFGRDGVHVIWFDDLRSDPRPVMEGVCRFAGIDPGYFATYEFAVQNAAMQMRRPRVHRAYMYFCRVVLRALAWSPRIQFRVKKVLFSAIPRYLPFVTQPAEEVAVAPELRRRLHDHYRDDLARLRELLGRPAPWEGRYG